MRKTHDHNRNCLASITKQICAGGTAQEPAQLGGYRGTAEALGLCWLGKKLKFGCQSKSSDSHKGKFLLL